MRPEGWKNPYYSHGNGDSLMSIAESGQEPLKHEAYEAGADAMLEGLLNSAESYHPNSGILKDKLKKHSFPKGRLVFIPEETE